MPSYSARLALSVLWLFLSFQVHAQGPDSVPLAAPSQVTGTASSFILIRATTTSKELRWVPISTGLVVVPPEMLRDSKSTIVTAKVPGTYKLLVYGSIKDKPTDPVFVQVIVTSDEPIPPKPPTPPGPPVPPTPPVPPVPPQGVLGYVVLVLDKGNETEAISKIVVSSKWRDVAVSKRAQIRLFSHTGPEISKYNIGPFIPSVPAMILLAESGSVLASQALKTEDQIIQAINQFTSQAK